MSKLRNKEVGCPAPVTQLIKSQLSSLPAGALSTPALTSKQARNTPVEHARTTRFPRGGINSLQVFVGSSLCFTMEGRTGTPTNQKDLVQFPYNFFQLLPQLEAGSLLRGTTDLPSEAVLLSTDQLLGTAHSHLMTSANTFRGQESVSPCQVAGVELKAHSEGRDSIHCSLLIPAPGAEPAHHRPPIRYVCNRMTGGDCRELGSAYLTDGILVKKACL